MLISNLWDDLTNENKVLIKQIGIAAISLYVISKLLLFLFPIALTTALGYLAYKKYISPNPRIMR